MTKQDDPTTLALGAQAKLTPELEAYFGKCMEKLGFVPNVLRAYAFDAAKLKAFIDMVDDLMLADSGLSKLEREMIAVVVSARKRKLARPSSAAKRSAEPTAIAPVTSGRDAVRAMRASMSLSMMQLKTLALAALSVPPISVQTIRAIEGTPCAAKTIAGIVVIKSSSTMRGLVNAM